MTNEKFLIRIVDDDPDVRDSLSVLLSSLGWDTVTYSDALEYLQNDIATIPGVLLLDVRMDSMSGLELQQELIARKSDMPIIFMSAYGELRMAVTTLKLGAVDFLQKPVDIAELSQTLETIREKRALKSFGFSSYDELAQRLEKISGREKELLRLLLNQQTMTNAAIAERLALSERTVEGHRARLYRELHVHNIEELVKILEICQTDPATAEIVKSFR